MFDFFSQALGWIQVIGEFFISTIESSLMAGSLIITTMTIPYTIGGLLPGLLGAGCLITLSFLIIRFLLGVLT